MGSLGMRDPQKAIDTLKAECFRYRVERIELLKTIDTLSNLLYEKYKKQDGENPLTNFDNQ